MTIRNKIYCIQPAWNFPHCAPVAWRQNRVLNIFLNFIWCFFIFTKTNNFTKERDSYKKSIITAYINSWRYFFINQFNLNLIISFYMFGKMTGYKITSCLMFHIASIWPLNVFLHCLVWAISLNEGAWRCARAYNASLWGTDHRAS